MWEHEQSLETAAAAASIWSLYRDVGTWPDWNPAVQHVELDAAFGPGATGRITPTGQGSLPFRIVESRPNEGYTSETVIAETVALRVTASLTPLADGGTRISHRITLTGPAADFFGQSFGPALIAGLPVALARLAEKAVKDAHIRPAHP